MKKKWRAAILSALVLCPGMVAMPAQAGTDEYLGEIIVVAFPWCPKYTTPLVGSIFNIAQNSALFSLLGTNFGGNGTTNFAVPDMQGRSPVGAGYAMGLSQVDLAEKSGAGTVTLTSANMPAHNHDMDSVAAQLVASKTVGTASAPAGKMFADDQHAAVKADVPTLAADKVAMAAGTVRLSGSTAATGSGFQLAIRQPYTGLTFCIVTSGIYPSRP